MIDVPIDAKVTCADGPCGRALTVIVNPVTQKVTHFVVEEKSLEAEQRLVPVDQVVETTRDSVRLSCTKEELAGMEPFVERHYVADVGDVPGYYWYATDIYMEPYVTPMDPALLYEVEEKIPPGALAIRRGTGVEATDGYVGRVGELVLDPANERITHLVLREGHLWGKKEVTLPLSAIDRVEPDAVYLKLDTEAIEQLPAIEVKHLPRKGKVDTRHVEMVAKVFDHLEGADKELEFVHDLQRRKLVKILDAAVLVKDQDGTVSVRDTRDLEPKKGRLLGAITGGLVGLVGGPVGLVVGALVGTGAGSLAAKWVDWGFSDEFLAGLGERLQPGRSGLIVLVEHEWAQPLSEALAGTKGTLLQQTLTDRLVEQLMDESQTET